MLLAARPIPELQTLSTSQYDLVFYSVIVAALAMFASFVYSWNTKSEVSARYRPAVLASMCITGVAFLSYLVIILKNDTGYTLTGGSYVANAEARFAYVLRYMDWSVTVPLLTAELIAVTTLAGSKARSTRFVAMASAFLMIVTGYLGTQVFDEGTSSGWLYLWGGISSVFFIVLYVVLVPPVLKSVRELPAEAGVSLRNAAILLFSVFGVYPVVYLLQLYVAGPGWTTTYQVALSAADIAAKVGFGVLIHKVAKARTAADILAGEDTNPEPVWISGVKLADGVQPELRDGRGSALAADGRTSDNGATTSHGAHRS